MNPAAKREGSQDKLGTMPIGKLLVTMSVPMMISMFIQALYNVVDSMFVARLSEDALTAVSMAFPIQNVMIALAVGTGVGVNALVSRSLGEGNLRRAEKAANVQIFLDVCYAVLSIVVASSSPGPISRTRPTSPASSITASSMSPSSAAGRWACTLPRAGKSC